jgi:acyl-CoA thioester hydrolase
MARIAIELPPAFSFSIKIPVRITDLNYGGHVGNDSILSLVHEARVAFLFWNNYTEKDLGGAALIMGDVAIIFKNELFYGDDLTVQVAITELSRSTFDIVYKLQKEVNGKAVDVALAKTGMVCFDYEKRKVMAVPEAVKAKFAHY